MKGTPMIAIQGSPPDNVDFLSIDKWWEWYQKGSKKIVPCPPLVGVFISECDAVGVDWLVLWSQFCIETAFAKSEIFRTKLNMFGLGAVDSDPLKQAAKFRSSREAVRAGAQHLAMYAGTKKVSLLRKEDFVLPRTYQLKEWGYFGIAKQVSHLGGKAADGKVMWSTDHTYGEMIAKIYESIVFFSLDENRKPLSNLSLAPEPEPKNIIETKKIVAEIAPKKPTEIKSAKLTDVVVKPVFPWWLKTGIKLGIKYGGTFVLGLLTGVSGPVGPILVTVWNAIVAYVTKF